MNPTQNQITMNNLDFCPACLMYVNSAEHDGKKHEFNFLLWSFNNYRKALSKDRHGINIDVTTENMVNTKPLKIYSQKGQFCAILREDEMAAQTAGIVFKFTVKNISKNDIYLVGCKILHPYKKFVLEQDQIEYKLLRPGAMYSVKLYMKAYTIGVYTMPISFQFQVNKEKMESFYIVKEMTITINDELDTGIDESKSPFTKKIWIGVTIFPPTTFLKPRKYAIPMEIRGALAYGLQPKFCKYKKDKIESIKICKIMEPGVLTRNNFVHFFHHLLWLDEIGAELAISRYNMENVKLKLVNGKQIVELEISGLEEKRPSLIKGDTVNLRVVDDNQAYTGVISRILDKSVHIEHLQDSFLKIIRSNPNLLFETKFNSSYFMYERMHMAVDACHRQYYLNMLFPENIPRNIKRKIILTDENFANKQICNNMEQRMVVQNILNFTSCPVPYLVNGPPGTGKTETIIEAVYQVASHVKGSKILICAPANSACDMITSKLAKYFTPNELTRLISQTANWDAIPEQMKKYYMRDKLVVQQIMKYKIIVSTLSLMGRFTNQLSITHLFIDEAAQAMEPESLIAIGGILDEHGQLILSGDPMQLRAMCNSKRAEALRLNVSLMERLMNNYDIYKNKNQDFIIKLLLNYRSHFLILKLPNEIFYNSELEAVSHEAEYDEIGKIVFIQNKKKTIKPSAVCFYGVLGNEKRDGKTPSYYNTEELSVVQNYVNALLNGKVPVQPTDIGIITPYQRQIFRVRTWLAQNNLKDIEVGSVESFQGREKRVIILSTVRSKSSLLLRDKEYKLGFVGDEKRFNVAITRAQSKLIVIGNPFCLFYDPCWKQYIKLCQKLGSYQGCFFQERTADICADIVDRLQNIHSDTQYTSKK